MSEISNWYFRSFSDISATCVVFGGKLELVQSILDVAEVVENIRFIIVDGSGKAADFITHGCNLKSLSR